ncbi:MAG TPA: type VI secretion system-associated protein TagF [Burkholderiales bacterium]|nr:type VI secretion system-associated protein TagF [Burkholderiales bacterium]
MTLSRVLGLYGKVPAVGDFVRRRLDSDFIGAWDAWLQRMMSESRKVLGERWLDCFLSAPVWRFVLPAGMFSKAGWVGLVLPSVDRVGRYFPLTIAAPIHEESIDVPSTLSKALQWLDSIEALALEALAPKLDLNVFDLRLGKLSMPDDVPVGMPVSDDTVSQATYKVWQFAPNVPDTTLHQLLENGSLGLRTSSALWLTRGGDTLAPCLAVCGGRMAGEQFCALLDGRWSDHSWTFGAKPSSSSPGSTQRASPGKARH